MTDTSLPPEETDTPAATDEAEKTDTGAEEAAESPISQIEGHVHDLLGRLRLDVNSTHVATVLGWISELSGDKPEPEPETAAETATETGEEPTP